MRDVNMSFERLAEQAFDCSGRRCDPLRIADSDEADGYFAGTLEGKKSMSAVIIAFMIKAKQNGQYELIDQLRVLYEQVWDLEDFSERSEYQIADRVEIMDIVAAIARTILGRDFYY